MQEGVDASTYAGQRTFERFGLWYDLAVLVERENPCKAATVED